jgi:hypothetical protein
LSKVLSEENRKLCKGRRMRQVVGVDKPDAESPEKQLFQQQPQQLITNLRNHGEEKVTAAADSCW